MIKLVFVNQPDKHKKNSIRQRSILDSIGRNPGEIVSVTCMVFKCFGTGLP